MYYIDEMPDVLGQLEEKVEGKPVLFVLYGLNTDSGNYSKPATFPASHLKLISPICSTASQGADISPIDSSKCGP